VKLDCGLYSNICVEAVPPLSESWIQDSIQRLLNYKPDGTCHWASRRPHLGKNYFRWTWLTILNRRMSY